MPPNYSDVELLALESNVIEEKEKREGRQSRFGAPKKNGKRRRVVVKRRRQKFKPKVVSRTIIPTTPTPTKTAKVVIFECETMKDLNSQIIIFLWNSLIFLTQKIRLKFLTPISGF